MSFKRPICIKLKSIFILRKMQFFRNDGDIVLGVDSCLYALASYSSLQLEVWNKVAAMSDKQKVA